MADGERPERDECAGSTEPMPPTIEARLQCLRDLIYAKCTHYQLLGVPRNADRKSIKRAYYELAALVHPDRHGGRDLGVWKPLMEALFRHVTVAHDTLGDPEARRIYDLRLPPESHPPPPRTSTPSRENTPPPRVTTPPPEPAPQSSPDRAATEIARRDALARRLFAGRASVRRQDAAAGPASTPRPEAEAPIVDVVTETTSLRAQAEDAEFRGEYTKATRSWRRLGVLDPNNAEVAQRTARSLLGSKASLHEAAEMAKKAVQAAPGDYNNHLLLAEIYLQAKLPFAARSVAEHALSLGHGKTELAALLARIEAAAKPTRK